MEFKQTKQAIEKQLGVLRDGNELTEDEHAGISGALSEGEQDLRIEPVQEGDGPVDNQTIESAGGYSEGGEEAGRKLGETSSGAMVEPADAEITLTTSPAVYDPDKGYEVQQAGWGPGIKSTLKKFFPDKKDVSPRTEAPDQPRPAYGDPVIPPTVREATPEDAPLPIDPEVEDFLNKAEQATEVDLYGKHSRVNFDKIESNEQFDDDFRRFLIKAMEMEDVIPEKVTFDEIILEAGKLNWTQKDIMKLSAKDFDNSAPMLKVRDLALQAAAYAYRITKRAANGDPDAEAKWLAAMANFAKVTKMRNELSASVARTVTSFKIKAGQISRESGVEKLEAIDSDLAELEQFMNTSVDEVRDLPPGLSVKQMARALLIAGDDASPNAWGEMAEEIPGMQEFFFAHMYPFMLSSFRTHAANWFSNGFVVTDYLATQGFAAAASPVRRKLLGVPRKRRHRASPLIRWDNVPLLNRIYKDTEDRKTAKEFLHYLAVLKQSLPEAWQVAKKSYKMEPEKVKMGKLERKKMPSEVFNAKSIQKFLHWLHDPKNREAKEKWFQRAIMPKDLKQGGTMARAFDWWGKRLDYPGKLLHSADEYAKTFSRGFGELDYAYRKAFHLLEERIITPGEFDKVVQQLLKGRSPAMQKAGETLAEFNTFQNDLGEIGKWVQEGREKVANWGWGVPWAHMVLAFIKTPVNIQKYNLHLLNLTKKGRADIMGKNGGAAQDEALGRWAVASLYVTSASGLSSKFFSDDVWLNGFGSMGMTVEVEGKEAQRARRMVEMNAGFKPCSIAIRDNKGTIHTYGFNTLEPIGTFFCATADITQNWHEIVGHAGEGEAMKVMASLYEILANNMINKNFAKNAHELMAVLMDPNQSARSPKIADNLVRMVIPRIITDMKTSLYLDDRYHDFEHSMDGFSGVWDVLKNSIPGLSQTLGPKVNYWNEPIFNLGSWGPDWLSPFRYSRATPDAVDKEMYRLLMPMRDLPRKLEGVKMHPRVRLHWYYLMNSTEASAFGGKKMKEAVEDLIDPQNHKYHEEVDSKFPGDPEGADLYRIDLIKKRLMKYKNMAKDQLLDVANPDPIVMEYQPDLHERIEQEKEKTKETVEPLDKSKMKPRSMLQWQEYYKTHQQQPPLGFK